MTRIKRNTFGLLVMVCLVVLVSVASSFWKDDLVNIFMMEDVYEINEVPYIGIHNNQDVYRQPYESCDTSASVLAVLEYWYPGENVPDEVYNQYPYCLTYDVNILKQFLEKWTTTSGHSYSVTVDSFSVDKVAMYINSTVQTPVITFLPTSAEQPSNLQYYPAVVITGVDRNKEELTINSYWGGPSVLLSFAKFEVLQNVLPAEKRNTFLIIQPAVLDEYDFDYVSDYNPDPAQVPRLSTEEQDLFSAMAAAEGSHNLKMFDLAKLNFLRFVGNPLFETAVPPIMQVWELSRFADAVGNGLEEYEEALEIIARADILNNKLDKPFSYFGSFDYMLANNDVGSRDRLSVIYIIEGDMYRKLGDDPSAIKSYQKALQIYSKHRGPRDVLNKLLEQDDIRP